jgi:2-polyprenyl-3-methyl-5-hydroxy-6-metoxy-1,4-benzoquinol methylase
MFLPIKCPVNEQFGAWLFNCRQVIQKNVYHQTNYSSTQVRPFVSFKQFYRTFGKIFLNIFSKIMSQSHQTRAEMPQGANKVLDRRNIENSYSSILGLLRDGLSVLDVGCGSGSITADIAQRTNGQVVGIDFSEHLIELAQKNYEHIPNLGFEVANINDYVSPKKIDLVIAARTLQWVNNPTEVVQKMVSLLKKGGKISINDYNHTKVEWSPAPPKSMLDFYEAFLNWRKDAGFDNEIADNLTKIYESLGLTEINIVPQYETSIRGEDEFVATTRIWSIVAETRGKQVVADGFCSEELRLQAVEEYDAWIANEAQSMTLYLLTVEGSK